MYRYVGLYRYTCFMLSIVGTEIALMGASVLKGHVVCDGLTDIAILTDPFNDNQLCGITKSLKSMRDSAHALTDQYKEVDLIEETNQK